VANNLIQGGGAAASVRGPLSGATWRGNILWQSSGGDMPGSAFGTVNPRLVKDGRGEHRLQAGSPAIDAAGGSSPAPGLDMDGQPRGGDPDVGADEVSTAPVVARFLRDDEVGPLARDTKDEPPVDRPPDAGAKPPDGPVGAAVLFEAEAAALIHSGTGTTVDDDENTSGGQWVGLAAENSGSWMEFTTPPLPAGRHALALRWKGNGNRGIARISVDGAVVGEPLDQYAPAQSYPTSPIGVVTFAAAGSHTIRLQVIGQNPQSSGFVLSADQFTFTPQ